MKQIRTREHNYAHLISRRHPHRFIRHRVCIGAAVIAPSGPCPHL